MDDIKAQIQQWLEQVVIGLNLCPFAGAPFRNGQVRIVVSQATADADLLADLQRELTLIDHTPATTLETTLVVVANMLTAFEDYNQFLDEVDILLRRGGWEGRYQVASFHPQYRFEGTAPDDSGNLTNRSPYPILHIIREASIDQAVAEYPGVDDIPERNIEKMHSLTADDRRRYFPWLNHQEEST